MLNSVIAAQRIGIIQARINERMRPTPYSLAEADLEMWAKKIGLAIHQGESSCRHDAPLKTLWNKNAADQHKMRLCQTYTEHLETLLGKPFRVKRVGSVTIGYVSIFWI
jgi:alpha-D-ribose 1-methylphosphonate 5-triphosphate synthase subunit PhnL